MKYKRNKTKKYKPLKPYLEKKLWKIFSEYIRRSHANEFGVVKCFTCETTGHWKEFDAGHFIKVSFKGLKFNENNVKPQCTKCNRFLGGNEGEFAYRLNNEIQEGLADELTEIKHDEMAHPENYKVTSEELITKIEEYKSKLEKL